MPRPARTTWTLLALTLIAAGAIWFLDLPAPLGQGEEPHEGRIVPFEEADVISLVVQVGALDLQLQRDRGPWRVVSPVQAPADDFRVGQVLDQLLGMTRGEVIDRRQQRELGLTPADYGLDQPAVAITVSTADDDVRIGFGRRAPVGPDVYIQVDGKPDIVAARTRLLDLLPADLAGWRDRTLFNGNPTQIRRIELQRRAGPLHFARIEGGGWLMEKPVRSRTAPDTVDRLLMESFAYRIEDFVAETLAASALYGLDEPAAQITYYSARFPAGETVMIGREMDNAPGLRYAARRGSNDVFAVSEDLLALLQQPSAAFRDRRLVRLAPRDILAVRLERGGNAVVLARTSPADPWRIVSPKQAPADAPRVERLLEALAAARIEAFTEPPESGRAELGLEPPAAAIHLFTAAPDPETLALPAAERSLQFGQPDTNGWLRIGVPGEVSVYLVASNLEDHLAFSITGYRSPVMLEARPEDLRGIRLTRNGITVGADLTTNGPAAYPADAVLDSAALPRILERLRRIEAASLVEDDPRDLVPYGLEPPAASLQVVMSGAAGIGKTLLIGGAVKGAAERYVMIPGTDVVFTLPEPVVEDLLTPASALPEPPPEEPAPAPEPPDGDAQPEPDDT